jgi:hypothetical protein
MMICGFPSMGKKKFLRYDAKQAMECGNLSSTLQKLYMWEKKLLHQVKVRFLARFYGFDFELCGVEALYSLFTLLVT